MIFASHVHRRGYTMVEMLVVMGALSLLLTVNAKWLYESMRFAAKNNERQQQHLVLKRLNSRIRNDIRQSHRMSIQNQTLQLFNTNEQTTTYTVDGETIVMLKEMNGKIISQDRFRLQGEVEIDWKTSEMPNWISLTVSQRLPQLGQPESSPPESTGNAHPTIARQQRVKRTVYHIRTGPNPWF